MLEGDQGSSLHAFRYPIDWGTEGNLRLRALLAGHREAKDCDLLPIQRATGKPILEQSRR